MRVTIIGVGNVGVAMAAVLNRAGNDVRLASRNPAASRQKIAGLNDPILSTIAVGTLAESLDNAELVLLCVPDSAIASVALELQKYSTADSIMAHCSGALDSKILGELQPRCSLHPLNTFPSLTAALNTFDNPQHDTALICEGDEQALTTVRPMFAAAGFDFQRIPANGKPLYHAACVMVCNYLSVIMDAGLKTAAHAELDPQAFWRSVQPLIKATLNNIESVGAAGSLSGPIARGDASTVANHIDVLTRSAPDLAQLYRALAIGALEITAQRGTLELAQLDELRATLQDKK